jgi:ribosomal protein S18 acetylase RimI-like enzyme
LGQPGSSLGAERPDGFRGRRLAASAWPAAGWAAARGVGRLYLQVEEDNLPALRLYERLGFRTSHHYHYRVSASSIAGVS